MQKVADFFRYYTHFYTKNQHIAALSKWRNGLLFLFVLSLYAGILPWWTSRQIFTQMYYNQILPIVKELPALIIKNDTLQVTEEQEIRHPVSNNPVIFLTNDDTKSTDHPVLITPHYMKIDYEQIKEKIYYKDLQLPNDEELTLKELLDENSTLIKVLPIALYVLSCGSLFLTGIIQCAFIAGLFFFLHRKLVRAPFIQFLKLSILASVPFIITYALFVFYGHQSILATLVPTIIHFIFFFRSISSLIEFQNNSDSNKPT